MSIRHITPAVFFKIMFLAFLACATLPSSLAQSRIAFVSTRDGDNEIYIMNGDGTGQTRVTSRSFSDFDPSLSPDGGTIVYASNVGIPQILMTNLDGSIQSALTVTGGNFEPCISRTRRSIVFTTSRDGNNRIYKMNFDGTNQTPLTSSSLSSADPCFSPDGTKIVFASNSGGFNDIYVMNADGSGQPVQLTSNPADDLEPMFSPDGTKVVFRSKRDGNDEIYIMNANGTNQVRLTQNSAYTNFSPSWVDPSLAPPVLSNLNVNPTQLTEGSSSTLSGNILNTNTALPLTLTINWDDGSPAQVLNYAGNTNSFSVPHQYLDGLPPDTTIGVSVSTTNGTDSSSIPITVFEGPPSVDNLVFEPIAVVNSNVKLTGIISDLGVLDIHNVDIDWGDGSVHTILNLGSGATVFISNHVYASLGSFQIHVAVNDGQLAAGKFANIGIVPPPTTGKIAFTSNYSGNNEIWLMNSNGTGQVPLTTNPASDSYPNISKDGSKIVFVSDRDGNPEIYTMNAVGAFQTRLTINASTDTEPVFSPDGSKIVFESNRDGNYEIYIMNANGTGQTRLTTNTVDDGQPEFSPDGTKIIFSRLASNQTDAHIFTMDLNGANQVALTTGSFVLNGYPSYSPDGTKIVFSSVRPLVHTDPEIYIMAANGTGQTRLTTAAGQDLEPVFSPNGSKIAFRSERSGSAEIFIMDSTGANQQRISFDGTGVTNFAPSWAAVPTVSVDIDDNLAAESGTSLTVPVLVSDTTGKGIISYDFALNYDPAVLTPQAVSFDTSSTLSTGLTVNARSNVPGTLVVSGFGSVPLTGAGTLLKLKFNVIGTAPTASDLTLAPFMFNEGLPIAEATPGHVFVQGTIDGRVTYGTAATTVGVPNVTLNAAGSPNTSTTTAASGTYHLGGFGPGAYVVAPSKSGDAGGITALDASLISQFLVGASTLTANQRAAGEVSANGTLTSFDAALIAQYVALLPNTGITATWRFLPSSRSYTTVGSLLNQNYSAILMGEVSGDWVTTFAGFASATKATLESKTSGAPPSDLLARTQPPTGTLTLATLRVKISQPFTVPITVKFSGPTTPLLAYQFDVLFDPQVIQPDSTAATTTGTLSSSFSVVSNPNNPGRVRVVVYGAGSISSNGTLINLGFRAVGRSGTSSNLSFANLLLNEGNPAADGKSGKITIQK